MGDFRRRVGDVGLGVVAMAVLAGAVVALKNPGATSAPSPASLRTIATPKPMASPAVRLTPTPTPTPTPSPNATPAVGLVVLIGPDFVALGGNLALQTGERVVTLAGVQPAIVTAAQLTQVEGTAQAVVVQVLAGAETTVRTQAALVVVKARWPAAKLVFVGPLSSGDRQSSVAVKTAAVGDNVTFLDPVLLKWRVEDTSAVVTTADRVVLTAKLAGALA